MGPDKVIIVHATITEQLGRLFSMDLELSSEDPALDFSAIIGGNATIRLELDKKQTRYWNGYVSRFVQTEADSKAGGRYRATLVPWLWFLTRTADCRIFQTKTIPDIIKQVFRDHGFTDFKDSLTGHHTTLTNCVQYRETDFNFVSRLMEHAGIYYFFTHENGKHTLVLADNVSAHSPYPNYDTINFRTQRGGVATNEAITGWTMEQEVQPGTYSLNDFNFEKPKTSLVSKSQITTHNAQSTFEIYDYPGEYAEQSEGTEHTKVRIEELHSQHEIVHGVTNARGVSTGYKFTLTGAPRRDQNRGYVFTSATYHLSGGKHGSGSGDGEELFSCQFTAIDSTKPFRSARVTPKPLIQGPQTAMVVGPSGEEIHTDKYGRIVVQFHWDRYGKHDENSSCWVRVSQSAWAGKKWGSMYIPRVGQEVIVEFLEGDPDRPIITGRVYNADAMPPYDLPAEKTKTTLKSNSSKGSHGFNELRFEDKKGGEQIFIHGQKNLDVRVRNDIKETNFGNRHERIGWKTEDGSGGSHFVFIQQDENTHVKQKHYEKVEDDSHLTITGEVTEKLDKSLKTHVTESHVLNAKESIIETSDKISMKTGQIMAQGSNGVHVRGKQIILEGDNICLVSGGNFVSLGPSGVTITGKAVMINSGGASLSSQPPAALPDISVMEPLDASPATDAQHGGSGHSSGGTVKRGGGPVTPILAPPYTPPPHIQWPTTKGCKDGGIACVDLSPPQCKGPYRYHDSEGRECNDSYVLEIVPPSALQSDTITVTNKGGACACPGALVKLDEVNGHVNVPLKVSEWVLEGDDWELLFTLFNIVGPKELPINVTCGKDQSSVFGQAGVVRLYPVNKFTVNVKSLEDLASKCKAMEIVAKGFAKALSWISGGKEINPYKDITESEGFFWLKVQMPRVSFSASGQFKENGKGSTDEWKVHKSWKLSIGVASYIDLRLDLVAVGVDLIPGLGPGFMILWVKIKSLLEKDDRPPFYLGFRADFSVTGSVSFGTGTEDGEHTKGAITGSGSGTYSLGGTITKDWVEVILDASTPISSSAGAEISKDGVKLKLELFKWGGVVGKASIKSKLKWFEVGADYSVQLIAPMNEPLWSPEPIKII